MYHTSLGLLYVDGKHPMKTEQSHTKDSGVGKHTST